MALWPSFSFSSACSRHIRCSAFWESWARAITAVYILRLMAKVFFGEMSDKWSDQTDISRREGFAAGVLASFISSHGALSRCLSFAASTLLFQNSSKWSQRANVNDFSLVAPEFLVTGLCVPRPDPRPVPATPETRQHFLAYLAIVGLAAITTFSLLFLWGEDDNLYGRLDSHRRLRSVFQGFLPRARSRHHHCEYRLR